MLMGNRGGGKTGICSMNFFVCEMKKLPLNARMYILGLAGVGVSKPI